MRSTVGSGWPRVVSWSRWRGVVTRTYRGVPLHLLGGPRSGGAAQVGQRLRVALVGALGAARAAQGAGTRRRAAAVRRRGVSVELDMSGVAAGVALLPRARQTATAAKPQQNRSPVETGLAAVLAVLLLIKEREENATTAPSGPSGLITKRKSAKALDPASLQGLRLALLRQTAQQAQTAAGGTRERRRERHQPGQRSSPNPCRYRLLAPRN